MTESSMPWGGTSTGDAGPYTSTDWTNAWSVFFTVDPTTQGIIPWYYGKLVCSKQTSSNLNVATGAAIVKGTLYMNHNNLTINVPAAVSTSRTDYIVLRKSYTAQTVRLTRLAGTEGGSAPSLTQNTTTYWDIKIASVVVNSTGILSVTNDNIYVHIGVPVNGIIYTTDSTAPKGFVELTAARGRFIVGMPLGGTMGGTVGTAFTNLGTLTHTHTYTEVPRHRHGGYGRASQANDVSKWEQMNVIIWGESDNAQRYLNASENGSLDYEGSATCTTASTDATMPYLQLMVITKS